MLGHSSILGLEADLEHRFQGACIKRMRGIVQEAIARKSCGSPALRTKLLLEPSPSDFVLG